MSTEAQRRVDGREYDLAVAYRVYPKVSAPAATLPFGHDKLQLADVCLRSFRESLGPLRAKVWAILDGCPDAYRDLFYRYFPAADVVPVERNGVGNRGTFDLQLDVLLSQQDAAFVYFAEDDYFYLPGQFPAMLQLLRENEDAHFVSPYDHLDSYTLELHRYRSWIRACGGRHWRTAASTCLTFLCGKRTLQHTERAFRGYSRGKRNGDCPIWLSLTKHVITHPTHMLRVALDSGEMGKLLAKAWVFGWREIVLGDRYTLWTPMPSIATHLAAEKLAPGFDWRSLMNDLATRGADIGRRAPELEGAPDRSDRSSPG